MIFNSTVIGFSHLQSGKACQDYSLTWQNSSGRIQIVAVSDGHGGDEYINSAFGARFACEAAVDILREFASAVVVLPSNREGVCRKICQSIMASWNLMVDSVRGSDPVKTFGCTLIAYLQTPGYWIGIQIGDGKFVTIDSEGWHQPIPWDDRCLLNFTTSICDTNAIDEFRYASGDIAPRAVFLSSDGIDGTFEDGDLLYNFYAHVMNSAVTDNPQKFRATLPEVLAHFSEVGTGDDMSLALIINNL